MTDGLSAIQKELEARKLEAAAARAAAVKPAEAELAKLEDALAVEVGRAATARAQADEAKAAKRRADPDNEAEFLRRVAEAEIAIARVDATGEREEVAAAAVEAAREALRRATDAAELAHDQEMMGHVTRSLAAADALLPGLLHDAALEIVRPLEWYRAAAAAAEELREKLPPNLRPERSHLEWRGPATLAGASLEASLAAVGKTLDRLEAGARRAAYEAEHPELRQQREAAAQRAAERELELLDALVLRAREAAMPLRWGSAAGSTAERGLRDPAERVRNSTND